MTKKIIALIGRPNVGKSRLFNRLAVKKKAIVHDKPGVTRDRKYADAQLGPLEFIVIDTPGLEEAENNKIESRMMQQTIAAIEEADLLCLIVDSKVGILPEDKYFANLIRKYNKKSLLIINKCESKFDFTKEYYKLGFVPVIISAEHNMGMASLYEEIVNKLDDKTNIINSKNIDADQRLLDFLHKSKIVEGFLEETNSSTAAYIDVCEERRKVSTTKSPTRATYAGSLLQKDAVEIASGGCLVTDEMLNDKQENFNKEANIKIVICGKPNSGKSTLINAIINEERVLTGHEAGITRDSIEIQWSYKGCGLKLIDTAGLRKKSLIHESLEKLSTHDTINSINFANVVILVVDAEFPLEHQDLNIANYVIEQGRCLVVAVNKWDLVLESEKEGKKKEIFDRLKVSLSQIKGVSVIFISALKKQNLNLILDEAIKIYNLWNKKISTSKLNEWLKFACEEHPLPLQKGGKRVRIKYMTQTKIRPPTFKLFSNKPEEISDSYIRYLSNNLREAFDFYGVPLRFSFVKTKNPYL